MKFDYEITDAMEKKAKNILSKLNDKEKDKFVILNFQKNVIFTEEKELNNIGDFDVKSLKNELENMYLNRKNNTQPDNSNQVNEKDYSPNKYEVNYKHNNSNEIEKNKNPFMSFKQRHSETYRELSFNKRSSYHHIIRIKSLSKLSAVDYLRDNITKSFENQAFDISKYFEYLDSCRFILANIIEKNEYSLAQDRANEAFLDELLSQSPQKFYTNKKTFANGSLYNLFNSEMFDIHLLMFYLSCKEEGSILDILVNIIYSKCINQSLFYIPQLCFLISIKKSYESIENYILDRCVDQIKFSLLANWLLSSYIEHDDIQIVKKFDKFMQRIEMTLVNGRRATISNYKIYNSLTKKSDEDVVLNSLDKEFKLEYFDKINIFYNELKKMCEKLKKYPKEDLKNPKMTRKEKLKTYLNRFNKKIKDLYFNITKNNVNIGNMRNSNKNISNPAAPVIKDSENISSKNDINNYYINDLNHNQKQQELPRTNSPNMKYSPGKPFNTAREAYNENKPNKDNFDNEINLNIIDEKILNYRFSSKSLSLFRGYILPFNDNISIIDEYNTLIVNFLIDYSFCFSTKARVPVKLTVETIKVFESEFWDELIITNEDEDKMKDNKQYDDAGTLATNKEKNQENEKKEYSVIEFNSLEDFLKQMDIENNSVANIPNIQKDANDPNKALITESNNKLSDINAVTNEENNFGNESRLLTLHDNDDGEEKDSLELKKNEERNLQELSRIIQQENLNLSSNLICQDNPLTNRNKNLSEKIQSYRKSVLSLKTQSLKKSEDFLAESSPSIVNPFGCNWFEIEKEIKEKSIFRNFETYEVKNFIAKANDDLRQELMTMQLIKRFDDIFKRAEIPLKLRPYEILITSPSSGLIEFIPNTISIDALKKKIHPESSLNSFFRKFFITNFEEAQKNFAESLAAYSICQYVLNIKDRHNGNILLDVNGYIIHIDFGFILGISPGNLGFENAPFKLTTEYVEILDGEESNIFHYFKSLILRGLIELRKNIDYFIKLVEIMSKGSKMPCFIKEDPRTIMNKLVERLNGNKSEVELVQVVEDLINNSIYNWRTVQYDNFQKFTNDIYP